MAELDKNDVKLDLQTRLQAIMAKNEWKTYSYKTISGDLAILVLALDKSLGVRMFDESFSVANASRCHRPGAIPSLIDFGAAVF